jgi:hypothetical protein
VSLPTLPAGPLYRVTAARKVTDFVYLYYLSLCKLVAKVNYNMFQSQTFRMWRRHAAATKNNDGRSYICVRKTQTNQSCDVNRRHKFLPLSCEESWGMRGLRNSGVSASNSECLFERPGAQHRQPAEGESEGLVSSSLCSVSSAASLSPLQLHPRFFISSASCNLCSPLPMHTILHL